MEGRLKGAVEGDDYVIRQMGAEIRRIPLAEADDKLRAAIKRNRWEALP